MSNNNENSSLIEKFDEEVGFKKNLKTWNLKLIGFIAISWSLFQLWYASPLPFILDFGKLIDVPARAVHLAFGLTLCFLVYPVLKSKKKTQISTIDFLFVILVLITTLYLAADYEGLVTDKVCLLKSKLDL